MVCIVDGDSNGPALVGVVDDRSGRDWPARDWASPILQATHEDAAPLEVVERTFLQRTQALAQLARLQWAQSLLKSPSEKGSKQVWICILFLRQSQTCLPPLEGVLPRGKYSKDLPPVPRP